MYKEWKSQEGWMGMRVKCCNARRVWWRRRRRSRRDRRGFNREIPLYLTLTFDPFLNFRTSRHSIRRLRERADRWRHDKNVTRLSTNPSIEPQAELPPTRYTRHTRLPGYRTEWHADNPSTIDKPTTYRL